MLLVIAHKRTVDEEIEVIHLEDSQNVAESADVSKGPRQQIH